MIDKTTDQRIVNRLNNAYGYSPTINSAAARALAELWAELERVKKERDRYWDFIRAMECESCSGDCDKCDGQSGWVWSGELSENADS